MNDPRLKGHTRNNGIERQPPPEIGGGCFEFFFSELLGRKDCAGGANRFASATFDACIGIDVVDSAFRDSVDGTFGKTCTASYARVSDNVSHNRYCVSVSR